MKIFNPFSTYSDSYTKFFLIGLTLSLIIGGGFVLGEVFVDSETKQIQVVDSESYEFWSELIQKVGARKAFDQLIASAQGLSYGLQHERAHLFGGILYTQEGVSGLTVCDERLNYGCFHEFLGSAIAELGLSSLAELNQACIDYLGTDAAFCQHGIGHGIQTYFGYTKNDLIDALSTCQSLPANDPIGGCSGGIFMEYNFRTMIAEENEVGRKFTTTNVFQPCSELSGDDLLACSYWQPQWWQQVQFEDKSTLEVFKKVGQQCREMLTESELLQNCFRGIGNVIPAIESITIERTQELCDVASDSNEHYMQLCVETARDRVIDLQKQR
ncbi:MAG: hypothetical protein JKX80_01010 [Candidatus Pacebacteria bacterium]|nr:hypothetical protein [Candidatus Paceibacterota bacterium]